MSATNERADEARHGLHERARDFVRLGEYEHGCADELEIAAVVFARIVHEQPPPDRLHVALGRTLTDYHWRAFCDAWLTIGLAAALIDAHPTKDERDLGRSIGRVIRKKLSRPPCGKYVGDNDGTCPQLTCVRARGHHGPCDNVRP